MKQLIALCLILGLGLGLAACSNNDEGKTENVFQGQVDALDKAKTVEGTLLEAEQKRRQQAE